MREQLNWTTSWVLVTWKATRETETLFCQITLNCSICADVRRAKSARAGAPSQIARGPVFDSGRATRAPSSISQRRPKASPRLHLVSAMNRKHPTWRGECICSLCNAAPRCAHSAGFRYVALNEDLRRLRPAHGLLPGARSPRSSACRMMPDSTAKARFAVLGGQGSRRLQKRNR